MQGGVNGLKQPTEPSTRPKSGMWQRFLLAALPTVVLALILLLTARAEYYKHGYTSLLGFVSIGSRYGERIGITVGAVGPIGYDGQFAYYLASHPDLILSCAHNAATCPLDTLGEMRVERILYPMAARLLSFGDASSLPLLLLLLNFVAILVTSVLVGQLCAERGASRWLGAAAGLFTGEVLAFTRNLNDPFALMWLVLAIYFARKDRWRWSAVALAAALLTREQLVLLAPFLVLPLIARRNWRMVLWFSAITLAPFVTWQVVLRATYGTWALFNGDSHIAGLAAIPFAGLWQTHGSADFKLIALTVALPLVLALLLAAQALRRDGIPGLLGDPLPMMVLVYGVLVTLLSPLQWIDVYGPGRLAAPCIVLAVILAANVARPFRAAYALLLAGPTALALATNLAYLLGAHPRFG